jgi:predicted MFS family arabinose efflux permease
MAVRFLGSYSDILRIRGTVRFVVAGWFGRLSRSTTSISTVLLVSDVTGSYALAGAVSGAIVVGVAVSSPLWSRAIDSRGQTRVVPFSLVSSVVAASVFVLAVVLGAPTWTWFVAAFFVGATALDYGTLVRARWSAILNQPEQRHASLALESVSDESVYVIGPPLVTFLAAVAGPLTGFGAGIAITIAGGIALLLQPATAPPVALRGIERPKRVGILPAAVLGVLPIYAGIGLLFASVDVTAVSVARADGQPFLAGVIVACFSVGSVIAAFLFGPLSARWRPERRVLLAALAFAIIVPTLLLVRSIPVLAVLVFFAGLVTSPVLISAISLIQTRTEPHRLTEALTWPSIGLSIGLTIGASLTGVVIDAGTAYSGYRIAVLGAVVVGVFGIVGALTSRRR